MSSPNTLPGTENTIEPMDIIPYGEDLLRPLDPRADLGTLACIQTLASSADDYSGPNDDWTFTEMNADFDGAGSVTSLN